MQRLRRLLQGGWLLARKHVLITVLLGCAVVGGSAYGLMRLRSSSVSSAHGASGSSQNGKQTARPSSSSPRTASGAAPKSKAGSRPLAQTKDAQKERIGQRYDLLKERIVAAVKSSQLNRQQGDALLKKLDELKAFRLGLIGATTSPELRSKIEAKRKEVKQWAEANKLPERYTHALI